MTIRKHTSNDHIVNHQYTTVADEAGMQRLVDDLWGKDTQENIPTIESNPPWWESAAANRAKDARTRAASENQSGGSTVSDARMQEAEAAARARDRVLREPSGPGGSRTERFEQYYQDELRTLRRPKEDGRPTQYARTGHDHVDRAIAESNARLRRLASDIRSERAIESALDAAQRPDLSRPVQHARPGRTAEHAPAVPRSPSRDQMENARRVAVDRCTREDAPDRFTEYFNAALGV